jgi:hypothetical protein
MLNRRVGRGRRVSGLLPPLPRSHPKPSPPPRFPCAHRGPCVSSRVCGGTVSVDTGVTSPKALRKVGGGVSPSAAGSRRPGTVTVVSPKATRVGARASGGASPVAGAGSSASAAAPTSLGAAAGGGGRRSSTGGGGGGGGGGRRASDVSSSVAAAGAFDAVLDEAQGDDAADRQHRKMKYEQYVAVQVREATCVAVPSGGGFGELCARRWFGLGGGGGGPQF